MTFNNDNRKMDGMQLLQKFIFPALIAALSAWLSVQITISKMDMDMGYIKRDIERQNNALQSLVQLQFDMSTLQMQVKNNEIDMKDHLVKLEDFRARIRALETN